SGRSDLPASGDDTSGGSAGSDGSDGSDDDAAASDAFECDPSLVPDEVPLRRLTKVQYDNTVRDLLRWALPDEGDAVADAVAPLVAAVPDDLRQAPAGINHGGFSRLDQDVHQ